MRAKSTMANDQTSVIKALLAKSGNECAFPGCADVLVTQRNDIVGVICHIEAANPGGKRYNPNSSDEERRKFENLVVLCYRHHKETDNEVLYPVDWFKQIKADHEARFYGKPFKVDESVICQLEREMQAYWTEIEKTNQTEHVASDFAVEVKVNLTPIEHFHEINKAFQRIREFTDILAETDKSLNEEIREHLQKCGYNLNAYDSIRYYKNPFFNRGFEIHYLAIPNWLTRLSMLILQAEVRFLEEYLKTHSSDEAAIERFEQVKQELREDAVSVCYAD